MKLKELSDYDAAVTGSGVATFGGNMRREREARHLTLEALATRLGLKRAAPLSTLELGTHVPKAETIVEYAAAIGCEPKDLLAGVMTPYDVLRGSTAPTPARTPTERTLTPNEKRAVRLLGLMSEIGQRKGIGLLAECAKAFPLGPPQESSARTDQRRVVRARTGRGTR